MNRKEIEKQCGRVLFSWNIHDFDKYEKSVLWYIVASIIGLALLAYSILTMNFLFAVIILMFAIIILLHDLRNPNLIRCFITEAGILLEEKLYRYNEFENFWILYKPSDLKNLYMELKGIRPRLTIPLENQNPNRVREILGKYLLEDLEHDDEPLSESIGRLLKI